MIVVFNVMLSSEMYLNWNLDLQVTLLKKRRIDAKLIQTNDLDYLYLVSAGETVLYLPA